MAAATAAPPGPVVVPGSSTTAPEPLRCPAEASNDICYCRRTVAIEGARIARPEISDADNDAYLTKRAKDLLHESAGGSAGRRGLRIGEDVLLYVGRDDRGFEPSSHHHRDDATSAESVVTAARVRWVPSAAFRTLTILAASPQLVSVIYQSARSESDARAIDVFDVKFYHEDAAQPMRRYFLYDNAACDRGPGGSPLELCDCGPGSRDRRGPCDKWHVQRAVPLVSLRSRATLTPDDDASGRRRRRDEVEQQDSEGRRPRKHKYVLAPHELQRAAQDIAEDEQKGYRLDV